MSKNIDIPLSEESEKKVKEIINILDGLSVSDAKQIILKLSSRIDSYSVIKSITI